MKSSENNASSRKWRRLKVVGTLSLLVGFLGSVVANFMLLHQATRSYAETSDVRLDPYGLHHTFYDSALVRDAALAVFFGDSRAQQWPVPQEPGFRFLNRGIANQTTEQIRGRFDAHVKALKPRVVIVQAGINDLKAIPLFPGRRDQIVEDCKAHLAEVIRRANDQGAVVIVTTIFPTGPVSLARRLEWSSEIDRAVEQVNEYLKTLTSDRVVVLDAWSILQADGHVPRSLAHDTLHLKPEGYAKLNAELVKLLESVKRGYARRP